MKTIVVAVDFSNITSILMDMAAEVAVCQDARVYIIHVAAPDPEFVGYKIGPNHVREFRARELKNEKKELEKLTNRLKEQGVDAIPLLIQGMTAELIITETQRLGAGLLIMGKHGHGAVMTALLGSTSHKVLKNISCPILLIPYEIKGSKSE
jgi:nucleotide-binding universal stress UspA family protein